MLDKCLINLSLNSILQCHKTTLSLWQRLTDIFTALNVALVSCILLLTDEENADSVRRNLLLDLKSINCLRL